ncbi:MAG TPA: hypothetical protein VH560_01210 [Polyangia bacterium]|jgi:hypothetical protein|nr:hypothetical protein [Polyangia bacterium]
MYTVCLQNWVRLRGNATTTLVQSQAEWVDLAAFQGVMPYIQVSGFGGSPTISIETSPTHDAVLFSTMDGVAGLPPHSSYALAAAGLQTVTMFSFADTTLATPPARWLRWKVTGTGNWSVVFRVWLNLHQGRGGAARGCIPPLPPAAHAHPQDQTLRLESRSRARAKLGAAMECARRPGAREHIGPLAALFSQSREGCDLGTSSRCMGASLPASRGAERLQNSPSRMLSAARMVPSVTNLLQVDAREIDAVLDRIRRARSPAASVLPARDSAPSSSSEKFSHD